MTLFAMFVITLMAGSARAQQVCPCVPVSKLWIASSCDTWACASAMVSIGGGDGNAFAVPAGGDDHRWIVVHQVAAGAFTDDSPFNVETFDRGRITDAATRLGLIAPELHPLILSAPDGRILVVSLQDPLNRQRAIH
ncbi:MAG TPA: hypothetical protein VL284_16660 [Thermoanaerobaculia bacterium]|nr:hypothetical protein [Thermoanaerobaculia bacterium]